MLDQTASAQRTPGSSPRDLAISPHDREVLRGLAARAAELAARPMEHEKRRLWYGHNALQPTRPLIFCDPENGWNEIITADQLESRGGLARSWEMRLRKEVFWGAEMGDDRVVGPCFDVAHVYSETGWGLHETRIGGLEERLKLSAGSEEGAWDFVRTHPRQLPVFVSKDGGAEVIAERLNYLLFDRMVAFHVQRGITVPLSAGAFYAGLAQRFPEREGMYFLPDQVAEYDKKRLTVREILQLDLFVTDESSAIQWLRQQLDKKPQTFQELHAQFLRELGGWNRNEKPLELWTLLEENFLRYDGAGAVPSQIHSYLSSNFRELRNRPKDDLALKAKAKDRWYVPDPNRAADLEKLRERALLREFEEYCASTQSWLRVFRLEAVRAGFRKAWQERDYGTIIAVARRIPESVLQEDPKLLMWYDQAVTRSGAGG